MHRVESVYQPHLGSFGGLALGPPPTLFLIPIRIKSWLTTEAGVLYYSLNSVAMGTT